ncbi:hypothetical protein GVAV_002695 [Gurleya vavrai]
MLIFISLIRATGESSNLCPLNPNSHSNQSFELQQPIESDCERDNEKFQDKKKVDTKNKIRNSPEKSLSNNSDGAKKSLLTINDLEKKQTQDFESIPIKTEELGFVKNQFENLEIEDTNEKISSEKFCDATSDIKAESSEEKILDFKYYDAFDSAQSSLEEERETNKFKNNPVNPKYKQIYNPKETQKFDISQTDLDEIETIILTTFEAELSNKTDIETDFKGLYQYVHAFYPELIQMEFVEFINYFNNLNLELAKKYLIYMFVVSKNFFSLELQSSNYHEKMEKLSKKFVDKMIQGNEYDIESNKLSEERSKISKLIFLNENLLGIIIFQYEKNLDRART